MTSTGSEKRLPFPGREGEETARRGEGMQLHAGDQSRSFTKDAYSLFRLPSLHSFYIITLPRHPGGFVWFKSSALSVRTHSLLGDWKERYTLHPSAAITCSHHTTVPSTRIQMLKCWACAIIPVEFECRKAAVVLTRTAIHYSTEARASPS